MSRSRPNAAIARAQRIGFYASCSRQVAPTFGWTVIASRKHRSRVGRNRGTTGCGRYSDFNALMGHANRCLDPKQAPGTGRRLEAAGLVILVVPVVLGLGCSVREPRAAASAKDASSRRFGAVGPCLGFMKCLGGVLRWLVSWLVRCDAKLRTLRWCWARADRAPWTWTTVTPRANRSLGATSRTGRAGPVRNSDMPLHRVSPGLSLRAARNPSAPPSPMTPARMVPRSTHDNVPVASGGGDSTATRNSGFAPDHAVTRAACNARRTAPRRLEARDRRLGGVRFGVGETTPNCGLSNWLIDWRCWCTSTHGVCHATKSLA
jgi:hypothetical protein